MGATSGVTRFFVLGYAPRASPLDRKIPPRYRILRRPTQPRPGIRISAAAVLQRASSGDRCGHSRR